MSYMSLKWTTPRLPKGIDAGEIDAAMQEDEKSTGKFEIEGSQRQFHH